jgi:hypothetical protein
VGLKLSTIVPREGEAFLSSAIRRSGELKDVGVQHEIGVWGAIAMKAHGISL